MLSLDIHEAKIQLSKLVEQAVNGQAFVIARAGMPLVNSPAEADRPRFDFMAGILVPDDFNTMSSAEVTQLFS